MPFGKLFFWPLFCNAQLHGVYDLKWSYGQILQSPLWSYAAPSGLFFSFHFTNLDYFVYDNKKKTKKK